MKSEDGTNHYSMPLPSSRAQLQPLYVTTEISLDDPTCEATMTMSPEPRLSYLAEPLEFTGSLRIHYPAVTLRDSISVSVTPNEISALFITCCDRGLATILRQICRSGALGRRQPESRRAPRGSATCREARPRSRGETNWLRRRTVEYLLS